MSLSQCASSSGLAVSPKWVTLVGSSSSNLLSLDYMYTYSPGTSPHFWTSLHKPHPTCCHWITCTLIVQEHLPISGPVCINRGWWVVIKATHAVNAVLIPQFPKHRKTLIPSRGCNQSKCSCFGTRVSQLIVLIEFLHVFFANVHTVPCGLSSLYFYISPCPGTNAKHACISQRLEIECM